MDSLTKEFWLTQLLEGSFTLYAKHPQLGRLLPTKYKSACNCEFSDILSYINDFQSSPIPLWDLLICPNPHSSDGKPRLIDMTGLRWFIMDIDPVVPDAAPLTDCLSILNILSGFMPSCPTCVSTGRGLQLWYPVVQQPPSEDMPSARLGTMRAIKSRLGGAETLLNALGWRIDPTCFDLAHIFRMPGSINTKTNTRAEVIALGSKSIDPWGWEVPSEPARYSSTPVEGTAGILCALSPQARSFIMMGAVSAQESRHRKAFIATAQLHEMGVPLDTALSLVSSAAALCVPTLTDWESIVRRVYARSSP